MPIDEGQLSRSPIAQARTGKRRSEPRLIEYWNAIFGLESRFVHVRTTYGLDAVRFTVE